MKTTNENAVKVQLQSSTGPKGPAGESATLEITGADVLGYGSAPTVTEEVGSTKQARKYRLGIPEGKPGKTPEIDNTLAKSGQAADAKATGDAIAAEKAEREKAVNELKENKVNQAGWNAGKYLGTGDAGNVVEKDAPSYTLPVATETTLGGVMPVTKTEEMTQAVGVDAQGGLWALPGGSSGGYELLMDVTTEEEVKKLTVAFDEPTSYTDFYLMVSMAYSENVSNAAMNWNFDFSKNSDWGGNGVGLNLFPNDSAGTVKYYIAHIKVTDGMVYCTDAVDGTSFDNFNKSSANNLAANTITQYYRAKPRESIPNLQNTRVIDGITLINYNSGTQPAGIGSTFKVWGVRG